MGPLLEAFSMVTTTVVDSSEMMILRFQRSWSLRMLGILAGQRGTGQRKTGCSDRALGVSEFIIQVYNVSRYTQDVI